MSCGVPGVRRLEVPHNDRAVGDGRVGVGVEDEGSSVVRAPVGVRARRSCTDLLADRLDVGVLNPFGLVGDTFVVEGVPGECNTAS